MATETDNLPLKGTQHLSEVKNEQLPSSRDEVFLKMFSFAFFMTMAISVSFFPLYFDSKGYTKIQIGALYSIGPLIGIFANLFWGLLSDKYQTIKKLLILLIAGQLATMFFLIGTDTITVLYILMTFFYFFQTPVNPLIDSLTMLTIRHTGKSYASFRVWGSLGFAFSALVFGMVLRLIGVQYTMTLCIGTITFTLIIGVLLKDRIGSSTGKMQFSGFGQVIGSPRFLWFLVLILILSIAHRMNDGFLTLYLREIGASDSIVGWAWTVSALSEIPVFFWLSRYGHRYKELPLLMIAGLVYAVRFSLVSVVTEPEWIILLQSMHSFSFGIFLFTALRYIQQLIPDHFRATGQAIFAIVWSCLAGLASGILGGWIFDAWGPHVMYRFAAVCALVASFFFLLTHLSQKEGTASK
jgi:PPP family 3-phenylpropionic acid transporter